jgi:hypothetical protein
VDLVNSADLLDVAITSVGDAVYCCQWTRRSIPWRCSSH